MEGTVIVERRFRGPADSANGGYACGTVAAAAEAEGAAEATLRRPVPLDRPLDVRRGDGRVELVADGELVAEGRPAELELEVPDGAGLDLAAAAEAASPWRERDDMTECFVCGPARTPPDGLGLIPGPVEGRNLVAAVWTPGEGTPAANGRVDPLIVWSVLDCPSGFGSSNAHPPTRPMLLGRMTALLDEPIAVGLPHEVIGWSVAREGRKRFSGSAILAADGNVCARALAVWIDL